MGNLNFLTLKHTLKKIKWKMTKKGFFIAYNIDNTYSL